jgi:hypothetical protein
VSINYHQKALVIAQPIVQQVESVAQPVIAQNGAPVIAQPVVLQPAVVQDAAPTASQFKIAKALPPPEVRAIYQKYAKKTLIDSIKHGSGSDALPLLNYHLLKPDSEGECCKSAAARSLSLELIKKCLPNKQFLKEHPAFIGDLYKSAFDRSQPSEAVLAFLSDREAIINCPERDAYLREDVEDEMHALGAQEGEYFEDLEKRLSPQERSFFLNRIPEEASRIAQLTEKQTTHPMFDSNKLSQLIDSGHFEEGLNAINYKMYRPSYYHNPHIINFPAKELKYYKIGTCFIVYRHFQEILEKHGEPFFLDLIKKTFPSKEYLEQHPELLQKFLLDFVSDCVGRDVWSRETTVKVLNFLTEEGVDLQEVSKKCPPAIVALMKKQRVIK